MCHETPAPFPKFKACQTNTKIYKLLLPPFESDSTIYKKYKEHPPFPQITDIQPDKAAHNYFFLAFSFCSAFALSARPFIIVSFPVAPARAAMSFSVWEIDFAESFWRYVLVSNFEVCRQAIEVRARMR